MATRIPRPRPKVTVAATSPGPTNDVNQGYGYFSQWYNTTTGELFTCVNPAAGVAQWIEGGGGGTVHMDTRDPLPTDDGGQGYDVGSGWLNTANRTLWVSLNDSDDAAVWWNHNNLAHLWPYVVGPIGLAPYQTIQAAIDQAVVDGASSSNKKDVWIIEDTYVEDLTLYDSVNLNSVAPLTIRYGGMRISRVVVEGTLTLSPTAASATVRMRGIQVSPPTGVALVIDSTNQGATVVAHECVFRSNDTSQPVVFPSSVNWAALNVFYSTISGPSANPLMTVNALNKVLAENCQITGSLSGEAMRVNGGWIEVRGTATVADNSFIGAVRAFGGTPIVKLDNVVFVGVSASDVVVDVAVATNSYFQNCKRDDAFVTGKQVPIVISGAQATTFKEALGGNAGDINQYDGTRWQTVPASSTSAKLSRSNQEMAARATSMDKDLACVTAVAATPKYDCLVQVLINGQRVSIGDGSFVADCYFSDDGGLNAKNIKDVAAADLLYWMGSVAGYQLTAADRVSFVYEV